MTRIAFAARGVAAALVAAAAIAPAASAAPKLQELVAFKDGRVRQAAVSAAQATVKVGRRRCTVGAATPLAALVRARPGKIELKDFGACSRRPVDAAQLYVRGIAGERASGVDGWVYKVGNKLASAGAGDPAGPFGHGRLKSGDRLTWFYCHMDPATHSCQRTLVTSSRVVAPQQLQVTVQGFDDHGRAVADAGAIVRAGSASAITRADGTATLSVPSGRVTVHAEHAGEVRPFDEPVAVP